MATRYVAPVGREMLRKIIPATRYWTDDYANLDESAEGLPIPELYGDLTGVAPVCIDTELGKWKFSRRANKTFKALREGGVTLAPTTEYTVNADNNEITIGSTPILQANTTYYFVLESDYAINGTDYLGFGQQTNPDLYLDGTLYYINGAGAWSAQSRDIQFRVYVKDSLEGGKYILVDNWVWGPGWNYKAFLRKEAANTRIAQSFKTPAKGGPWYLSQILVEASLVGAPASTRTTRMTLLSSNSPETTVGSPSYRLENYPGNANHAYFPQRGPATDLRADIEGRPDGDGNLMTNVADILEDIYVDVLGGSEAGLNAADLAALKAARTEALAVNLDIDREFGEQLRKFERGQLFKLIPGVDGTFRLKYAEAGEPAGTPHYRDHHFHAFSMRRDWSSIYAKVKVKYAEDPALQEWLVAEAESSIATLFYRNQRTLEIETNLTTYADALQLAEDYLGTDPASSRKQHLQKPKITVTFTLAGGLGWNLQPADKVKISRERAMSSTGSLVGVLFIVQKVVKKPLPGTVEVTAVLDSQAY